MLKQPLLSRMFKLSGSYSTPDNETSSEKPEREQIKLALEKTLEEKKPEEKAPDGKAVEEISAKQLSTRKRLSRNSILKLAAAVGLLATGSGFAVVRTSPETLLAVLPDTNQPAPLSRLGDPTAEPVMKAGDLFLTNQILYRKLEAIAGVALTAPAQPDASVTAASSTAVKPPAAAKPDKNSAAGASIDSKPAETEKADTEKVDAGKPTETAKPDPDGNVVAAAPPAPQSAPVDFSGTTIDNVLDMRVAVAKDVPAIGFATSNSGVITDLDGNALKDLSAEQGVTAEIAGGIVIEGETMPSAFWVYPEDGGYVAVGDSWYRGRVLIALRERGLIAVNHVLLGDYLYSVVGTEMSATWPIESLKAQAIAARSYALTHNIHPASEDYFDLDNTERFQAYKGLAREANTTQAAVQATAGEFISHEGGIVESLYAASQAIVDDAHKGSGMSQLGAKDLAEQGYSYQEILAHYYPGTALGRLETDQE